ncbi:aminotransferase class I/II-fold pyridoxal phosphate-dependent enzyme [Maribacter sp. Hel_I_7]|uniref:aminotransferase class I/II-fold pyridoxal phosphate-dependent enzyme n=1 Tax=Maribacter sp. Hel_I_7 TaxID=1249997 RepID=UPI00047AFEF5|nr:pyridoxal phosphate-dependent aminotransferase family protein [Maribacter sp. Hel_I_7]|eukprot:TRINITY_DN1930_c0_g2_i1.p1 TRINITY_DN1930_c0_g2~~TRINITY_DN1930_c0_g2_i1.p1  ORF type:complete len:386 (-),score=75.48 TRINITY_DN1930_c0_g2_i1:19-1176(-)
MNQLPKKLLNVLENRKKEDTFRSLNSLDGLIDFLSNDYLGFATNETLFSKTFQLLLTESIASNGSGGSRLLSGNHKLYQKLEPLLAAFYKSNAALVFNSGYDANMGLFSALPQRGDLVFYDEFVHASIREGIRMSNAKAYSFLHNNLSSLEERINLNAARNENEDFAVYIVTESVFSMDGDSPDLKALAKFSKSNGYNLIVDEAHAVGVLGKNGEGLIAELGLENDVFARTVTFGKAFGCHGAAILGSEDLKNYLVNFAKPFIYTTALTPHTLATIITAHEYINELGKESKATLKEHIEFFKNQLKVHKIDGSFIPSDTPIQGCIVAGSKKVKQVSKKLIDKGFNVKAILSPTVPEGQERLRICLHSFNSKEEIGLLVKLLAGFI